VGLLSLLRRKIKASLAIILMDPDEGKALKEELAGLRSFRVSRFRIEYRAKNKVIEIGRVGPGIGFTKEPFEFFKSDRPGDEL
jgi:mRNA interferase RelE/StbE